MKTFELSIIIKSVGCFCTDTKRKDCIVDILPPWNYFYCSTVNMSFKKQLAFCLTSGLIWIIVRSQCLIDVQSKQEPLLTIYRVILNPVFDSPSEWFPWDFSSFICFPSVLLSLCILRSVLGEFSCSWNVFWIKRSSAAKQVFCNTLFSVGKVECHQFVVDKKSTWNDDVEVKDWFYWQKNRLKT